MSADDLRGQFEGDAERFREPKNDGESLTPAVGYWLGYPLFLEVIDCHGQWETEAKYSLQCALASAHHGAVQVLMRAGERLKLDSSALWEEGRVCRELFHNPQLYRYEPYRHEGQWDLWPDCLGPARYQLPEPMQEAIRQGETTFMRLVTLLGMSPDGLARIAETVKRTSGAGDCATDRPEKPTANTLMLDMLTKNPESQGWSIREWEKQIHRGQSTIQGTPTWGRLQELKAEAKAEKAMAQSRLNRKGVRKG